jgi:hypothetical protein
MADLRSGVNIATSREVATPDLSIDGRQRKDLRAMTCQRPLRPDPATTGQVAALRGRPGPLPDTLDSDPSRHTTNLPPSERRMRGGRVNRPRPDGMTSRSLSLTSKPLARRSFRWSSSRHARDALGSFIVAGQGWGVGLKHSNARPYGIRLASMRALFKSFF